MADCKISAVHTGIAGSHIRSTNSRGMVKIKEKEVTQADIDRVLETASSISLAGDQQILHVLEQACQHRRTGRHQEAAGHERDAAGCRSAYRNGRSGGRAEHHEVHTPLWSGGQ